MSPIYKNGTVGLPVVAFEIATLWIPFSSSICRNRTDPPSCSVRNYHALAPASSLICKNSLTVSFLVGAFQPLSGPRHVTYLQEQLDSELPGCNDPTTLAFFASPIYKNTAELPGCSALYYHSLVPCLVTYLQTQDSVSGCSAPTTLVSFSSPIYKNKTVSLLVVALQQHSGRCLHRHLSA